MSARSSSANTRFAIYSLFLLATACGEPAPSTDSAPDDGARSLEAAFVSAPVPVGPFLDGVFPTQTPSTVLDGAWSTVQAYPVFVGSTTAIESTSADNRIYVSTLEGLIQAFEDDPGTSAADTFLDLRDRVALVFEGGLLGFALHPDFGQPGSPQGRSFYVYYTSHCPIDSSGNAPNLAACDDSYPTAPTIGFYDVWIRLSRFEVFEGTLVGDPSSEQILYNVRLLNGIHRGGAIDLRDNGRLFLSVGDLGDRATAQTITDNFNGSVLRIDVNVGDNGDGTWTCPAGSHQPRRTFDTSDEVSGRYYCIPDDNPFLDPGGSVLEEYCALGLRNPYRLGIDSATGRVWVGDVGDAQREEVNVIECGRNYGWPFREGTVPGPGLEPATILGVVTEPVVDFTRDEARSIIGGNVYRGTRFPDLVGKYLVGDFVTSRIWAIDYDEATSSGTKDYLTDFCCFNLGAWGQKNDGEVLIGNVYSSGRLYTLDRTGTPTPDAPALLSETGAFANMAGASQVWVPYGLNQPFWSDGAIKSRFLALPNDGVRDDASEKIGFSETGNWSFPTGTVIMKHFELAYDARFPALRVRLETRFLVLGTDDLWYGLTYRWRTDNSDADLLTGSETGDYLIRDIDGVASTQTWYFPSRTDCLTCHIDASGGALGLRTNQLNGDLYELVGIVDNQLEVWNDLGMFTPALDPAAIPTMPKSPALGDVTAPLQDRARSWLDSNCGYCHRPGGVNAGFDARWETPYEQQGFVGTAVRDDLGVPGMVVLFPGDPTRSALAVRAGAVGAIGMPPLAKSLPETPGVNVLTSWIERLPESSGNDAPTLSPVFDRTGDAGDAVSFSLSASDFDGDAIYFDAANLPEGLSIDHDSGLISGTLERARTWTVTVSASDGPTVDVETFDWAVSSICAGGEAPPCDPGTGDCRASRGRSPFDPFIALAIFLLFAARLRNKRARSS